MKVPTTVFLHAFLGFALYAQGANVAMPKNLLLIPAPREMSVNGGEYLAKEKPRTERLASIPPEGYELSITTNGIAIRHSDEAGAYYANVTLSHLGYYSLKEKCKVYSCLEIKDSPAFRWRGVHLDEARHFFGKATVKKILDMMARYKLNVFHWHLTDDQAWVLDVPGFPNLVRHANGATMGEKIGPFYYTANDVREIVVYAKARHITIVPELDFPGHCGMVAKAYPEFTCQIPGEGRSGVLCVGNPKAMRFVEKVLDWACELFPAEAIHIGGDECSRAYWRKCPRCQEFAKREGLTDVEDIQPWVTKHLAEYLAKKGRKAVGWEEIAVGRGKADENGESENKDARKPSLNLQKNVLVMGYHIEPGARAANMGYKVVQTPNWRCYFDYTQQLPEDPFRYFIPDRRWLPFKNVYRFDPYEGVKQEARSNVIGGQCCNWTEVTYNQYDLEWKIWPRAFALAEILWSYPDPDNRDLAEFSVRAEEHRRRLIREHVNCAPLK